VDSLPPLTLSFDHHFDSIEPTLQVALSRAQLAGTVQMTQACQGFRSSEVTSANQPLDRAPSLKTMRPDELAAFHIFMYQLVALVIGLLHRLFATCFATHLP
jgi:hypothetical protein